MFSTFKSRHRQLRHALLALTVATLALPCAAQWKWRDAQGRLQYSDRPPPADVRDRDILMRPAAAPALRSNAAPAPASAPAPVASASAPTSDPAIESRKRLAESVQDQARRDEEARVTRQKVENCARAREHARTLDSGQRISRSNDKGEREFLDDAQRARETARTRDIIASDCR